MTRLRIGISACLLGHAVRHDGGHKRDQPLIDAFGDEVEWVPICPEVDIGLGTPRPPIDLQMTAGGLRLVMPSTGRDLTDDMRQYAERKAAELEALGISGYVLKSKSPSCGAGSARVIDDAGTVGDEQGTGLFVTVLREKIPELPMEEEVSMAEPDRRRAFIAAARAYRSGRK